MKNIYEVFLLESILTGKEILWRINFILIKFFLNEIPLEKIQNEWKKKHHFSIRLRASSRTTGERKWKMRCCLFTFTAFYSRGFGTDVAMKSEILGLVESLSPWYIRAFWSLLLQELAWEPNVLLNVGT